jgi:hypothetical protein
MTDKDWEKTISMCVDSFDLDRLYDFFESSSSQMLWEEKCGVDSDTPPDENEMLVLGRELLVKILKECVAEVFQGDRRDISEMHTKCPCGCEVETSYYVTGCMSWGDEPDTYKYVSTLDAVDITAFAKTDLEHLADIGKGVK